MPTYSLKSLNLPKLYGTALAMFTRLVAGRATRALVMGSLLDNAGIPAFRKLRFEDEPVFFPLVPASNGAPGGLPAPSARPDSPSTPTPFHRAADFTHAYAQGSRTPQAVAERVIRAIAESDRGGTPLRAFIASRADDIQAQAAASAARWEQGRPLSPLDGVPVAVKDEVDMLPYPTTVGTKFLGGQPAPADSFVAQRLREAGAILVGKTNMHEIGINPDGSNVHHGRAANPYALDHDTGGSSSGSAAAVAAGLVPAAVGADGGGSIRIPAALCGVVGLKPTFGRVSERGAAPLCWSVAHLGPIAATVEDAALVYAVIAGPDPQEALTLQQPPVTIEGWNAPDLTGLRAGVYPQWFQHAAPELVDANLKMVETFKRAGMEVVEVEIPELDEMRVAHAITILSEMAASMENYPEHRGDFADSTRLSLVLGGSMSAHDYIQSQRMRARAMRIFAGVFEQVDVILTPATALPAPRVPPQALSNGWSDLGTTTEMMRFIFPANFTGNPAISFPVGYSPEGLPLGMQAIGRHWQEHILLRVAYHAEQAVARRLPGTYFDLLA